MRIENHCGRIRATALGHYRHVIALAPCLELFNRSSTKGIAGGQHDGKTFFPVPLRQFANGGGFARAVDAHHEDHKGLARDIDHQELLQGSIARQPACTAGKNWPGSRMTLLATALQGWPRCRWRSGADIGRDEGGPARPAGLHRDLLAENNSARSAH
jgi:hypothetical protein